MQQPGLPERKTSAGFRDFSDSLELAPGKQSRKSQNTGVFLTRKSSNIRKSCYPAIARW